MALIVAEADPRPCGREFGRAGEHPLKVAYLFTTFPLLTETPAQRELRVLRTLPVELQIYSLWGGGCEFEGIPIRHYAKWRLIALLWWFPYWLSRRPGAFLRLAVRLASARARSLLNAGETLLGLAFALCYAAQFSGAARRPDLLHAAWATLPATAAQLLSDLTGIPFSMGAHAYDVFRNGGDWLLSSKLQDASLVITSSESTRKALLERGADPDKTALIRRGLDPPPTRRAPRARRSPLRVLAVGRLIEKKGYHEQLVVYAALKAAGLVFEARIVGAGPLERALKKRAAELGLTELVRFVGSLPHDAVVAQYAWADVMLFTGHVARNGDRDGLPNVIPEAMAAGVVVVANAVAGVSEAVEDGRTGILITKSGTEPWIAALRRLQSDDRYYDHLCAGAGAWVEAHYDARRNTRRLLDHLEAVMLPPVETSRTPSGEANRLSVGKAAAFHN
ncbi:MAG: glycosyltransferase [Alphaproteobacteria bacterium]